MAAEKQTGETLEKMEIDPLKPKLNQITGNDKVESTGKGEGNMFKVSDNKKMDNPIAESLIRRRQDQPNSNSYFNHNNSNRFSLHNETMRASSAVPKMLIMDEEKSPAAFPCQRRRTFSTGSQSSMSLNVDCSSPSPSPVSIKKIFHIVF